MQKQEEENTPETDSNYFLTNNNLALDVQKKIFSIPILFFEKWTKRKEALMLLTMFDLRKHEILKKVIWLDAEPMY